MISPEEIKEKALRRYKEYLRSIVNPEILIFPLEIRGDKKNSSDFSKIQEEQLPLFKNDKSNIGYGYTLESEVISGKIGAVRSIKKIEFTTEGDYLKFIDREDEVTNFKKLLAITLAEFPELKILLSENPGLLSENLTKWVDLLSVSRFFRHTPKPGLYTRELPVEVHTKFIEDNTEVLNAMLSAIISEHVMPDTKSFEERFNLKTKHNLIRLRFLDPSLSPIRGFEEIGIAEIEINKLSLNCKRVFIIENDITALTFPQIPDSIAIFGKGYNVASLKRIDWLKQRDIYYWSDIDVQGFEMLSQIRGYFRQVQSLLMDEKTFNKFNDPKDKGTLTKKSAPSNLMQTEFVLYKEVKENNFRLEQEKIPQYWIKETISSMFSY
jgi:hypothetical protein